MSRQRKHDQTARLLKRIGIVSFIVIVLYLFYVILLKSKPSYAIENRNGKPLIAIVMGTRPEAIKLAPLIIKLKERKYKDIIDVIVISTGQHRELLSQNLKPFDITVDVDLGVMVHDQTLTELFSAVFNGVSKQLMIIRPNLVIVQGDTTTALAAAMASAHLNIEVAHVEAGLRTFDVHDPYPEEINRKVIDSFAKWMYTPTKFSAQVLHREGACKNNVIVTGNTGIDALYMLLDRTKNNVESSSPIIASIKKHKSESGFRPVILVTMHRRENHDRISDMCDAISDIVRKHPSVMVILPVHPNPKVKNVVTKKLSNTEGVNVIEPISYEIFPHIVAISDIVITDSGGIQEEAASLGKPVVLMRETTERPEGVYKGSVIKVGGTRNQILEATDKILDKQKLKGVQQEKRSKLFGDGNASKVIADHLLSVFKQDNTGFEHSCSSQKRQDDIANVVYKKKVKIL
jgi:UDP-N-acetylglucosamine 2-epimerase (non-hydrolysing)